jgi:hypothetical protein
MFGYTHYRPSGLPRLLELSNCNSTFRFSNSKSEKFKNVHCHAKLLMVNVISSSSTSYATMLILISGFPTKKMKITNGKYH